MITDRLPDTIRVVVVAATGVLRTEVARAFDDDFEVVDAADARSAEEAARRGVHALVIVGDDLYNCAADEVVQRVRLACPGSWRVAVMLLAAHGELPDLSGAYHWGADDACRWPLEADMLRARVRSIVRVSALEAAMGGAAEGGALEAGEMREALSAAIHLVNNAVAGISGRAQLATLTGSVEDAGLVPICLSEARKVSLILNALHRLSESTAPDAPDAVDPDDELVLAGVGDGLP